MEFTPLNDRVLVVRQDPPDKTPFGLTIPESAREKQCRGTVVAVGSGRILEDGKVLPVQLKVGQSVLLPTFGGAEVRVDDEKYVLFREDEILGIFG